MSTLLISPDYASHYYGLSALGREGLRRGARVIVATGPTLRERVLADGFEHVELRLGAGHNDGVNGAGGDAAHEDAELSAFVAATRSGMVATLAHQVSARQHDMLWRPDEVHRRLRAILAELEPERIVVDQLAYGATLALRALDRPFVSFQPSHPCQVPHPGQPDAFPIRFPSELTPPADELARLRALCEGQTRCFTDAYNAALTGLNPAAAPVDEAASAGSPQLTVVAYPEELAPDAARPGVTLVGPVVREERADDALLEALARRRPDTPTVYISLGTFLSAREDVLARILTAVRRLDVNAVVSTGIADHTRLGPFSEHWHVAPSLPQVAVLAACDAVVCHGGNNTVMEALSHGLPVLAGPMSSDQFVAAEDLRRAGVGDAFAPNDDTPTEIAGRIESLLTGPASQHARSLGQRLGPHPGAARAWTLIDEHGGP